MEFKGLPNGVNFILTDLWVAKLLSINKVSGLYSMLFQLQYVGHLPEKFPIPSINLLLVGVVAVILT